MTGLSGRATRIIGSETRQTESVQQHKQSVVKWNLLSLKKNLKFRPVLLWIKTYYYYKKKYFIYFPTFVLIFNCITPFKKMYLLVFSNLQDTLPFRQAATLLSHVYFAFHKLLKCADAEYWFGFCLYCLNEWVPPSLGCGGHLAEILLRAAGKAGVRRVLFV